MKKLFNIKRAVLVIGLLSTALIFAKENSTTKETNTTLAAVLLQTTPPAPIIVNQTCSSAELQNTGTIPSGEMWYWQTTKHGTDTNYPATSNYIANGSGTYRLRPLHLGTNTWGVGSNVVVTLDPNAGSNWYLDADGDGLGDPNVTIFQCLQPFGYVNNSDDQCPDVAGNSNDGGCAAEDPDNQNYIYTITARVATTDIDTLKGTTNGIENVSYFDGLGRAKQSVAIRAGGILTDKNALLYDWTVGNTGSTGFFNQEGTAAENTIVNGTTPFGNNDLLWECKDDNNGGGSGWITDDIAVDPTKAYRYTTWVKINDKDDGRVYHGLYGVNNLDGTTNSNPYFYADDLLDSDTWYLLVGIVHPHDHTGGDTGLSGVYDAQGNKLIDATEFKWDATSTTARFRNYVFNMNNTNTRVHFWSPLVQQIDGSELPLSEVLTTSSVVPNQAAAADIVTHIEYDQYGRQLREYLPFATYSNDGKYRTGDMSLVTQNYYKHKHPDDFSSSVIAEVNAYSEKTVESSPLGRVFEQTAPGEAWKKGVNIITGKGYSDGHSIRFEYDTNTATEVKLYNVSLSFTNNTYTPTLTGGSTHYPVGELSKTVTKDENWVASDGVNHTTEEFKDKNGQVLLKRTYNNSQVHDTYYVYDDYGNLTYVLPPKAEGSTATLSTIISTLNDLSYQYKYDHRNRLVEKKIPGKGWEYIVYDKLDRPVLTQDAVQATNNKWLFTKYDILGRVVYTGIYDHGSSITRTAMQNSFSSQNDAVFQQYEAKVTSGTGIDDSHYTNNNFPSSNLEVLTVNYYDNYSFDLAGGIAPTNTYGVTPTTNVKTLATGSRVKVLGTSNWWTTTVSYYDEKARPIYVYSNNAYLGTIDKVESKLDDFTGRVLETKTTHQKAGNVDVVVTDVFEYDPMDRLVAQTQKVNNQTTDRLVQNNYDELGQLESKLTGSGTRKGYTNITSGVTVSDDVITCTGNGWDIGLSTLGSFQGDGYVEFSPMQNGKYFMAGLSDNNTTGSYQDIDYAIYIHNTAIYVFESGISRSNQGSYQANDVFRVERIGNKVYYKQNGKVFYTSTVTSTNPLFGDISMYHNGAKIKDLHVVDNSKGLQKVDYSYNVRGWLKNINNDTDNDNDLFNFNLRYNDPTTGTALFNGNISQTSWNTLNTDSSTKTYTYSYDALNRILGATGATTDNYDVSGIVYDKNGNIMSLTRRGHTDANATTFGNMDILGYTYASNSNQLTKVADTGNTTYGFKDGTNTGDDYTYDVNGNMITDNNKNISNINYNHLNLPTQVTIGGQNIDYVYDASGVKLRKTVQGNTTDYAGNHIYENGDLQFFNHAEGYVNVVPPKNQGGPQLFRMVYQYKDHLGNVRLSYADTDGDGTIDAATEIIEESNYYPFGLKHKGYNNVISSNGNSTAQKRKFGGMEYQDELGLNWYDITARNYDAALGRWMNIDPLAEDYYKWAPYNYSFNSPLKFNDPTGESPEDVILLIDREGAGGRGHMGMLYQDGNGDWYYYSQGATTANGSVSMVSGSDTEGGVVNVKLQVTESVPETDKNGNPVLDKNGKPVMKTVVRSATEKEALTMAKKGSFGRKYDDSVKIETTVKEDEKIANTAKKSAKEHKNGKRKYNMYTNNCVDACQDVIQRDTNVFLQGEFDPIPNNYFNKVKSYKKLGKTLKSKKKSKKKTKT